MPDILNVTYAQTGNSSAQNALGMREMQARAYEKRNAQFLLLKAPPASGKSRALMFLALDKIHHQGLTKAIIAVPEMSIGGSFQNTDLKKFGFFADWRITDKYNLCTVGNLGKVDTVLEFLNDPNEHYLLCTHATLRFTYERLPSIHLLDRALVAIDEFHHTSAEEGNKLGAMLDDIMTNSTAHVVAMTGSYFRGDQVPILSPEAEARFTQVTYTYYEQLNGYKYLKSLGLGYHFYQGRYFDALPEVLDLNKKTIIHIPNVNSRESSGMKYDEVDIILDTIGSVEKRDAHTGILTVKTRQGRRLKVADLVSDDSSRTNVLNYLRGIKKRDEMDIIIALGMAKEGFDWPWCEHVLTIGYRNSMTEAVQIIGRATRDCEGKTHAQFTNLIAQPDAADEDVKNSVNNLLKAISLSLLMREVLAPNINFRPRSTMGVGDTVQPEDIIIEDSDHPVSPRVQEILNNGGINDVLTTLINTPEAVAPALVDPEQTKVVTDVEMPKIISQIFPDLHPEEISLLNDLAKTQLVIQSNGGLVSEGEPSSPEPTSQEKGSDTSSRAQDEKERNHGVQNFLRIGSRLINVDYLNIDLIDQINPFQGAYEIISKSIDAPMLKTIQDHVTAHHSTMTEEEAVLLWEDIKNFTRQHGTVPSLTSSNPYEKRLAEALAFVRSRKAQKMQEAGGNK